MDQIDFFSKKVISSKSGEKYAQIKHCLQVKKVRNTSKHILVDFDVRGQQWIDLITGGSVIVDYGFVFLLEVTSSDSFNVKNALMMDLLITNRWVLLLLYRTLIDGLESCGLVMFLSAVWTLILTAPIHSRGSNGEQVM